MKRLGKESFFHVAPRPFEGQRPEYSQFESHFTGSRKGIARSQEQSVQNQQHNKTLNPKISVLVDAIVNEEVKRSTEISSGVYGIRGNRELCGDRGTFL
jgi:hypothetical protein